MICVLRWHSSPPNTPCTNKDIAGARYSGAGFFVHTMQPAYCICLWDTVQLFYPKLREE